MAPPSLGAGRAGVSDTDLSDSTTHILPVTPPCLWWVSHSGCKREIIEIGIWGASGEKSGQGDPEEELGVLAFRLPSALLLCLHHRGQKETDGGPGEGPTLPPTLPVTPESLSLQRPGRGRPADIRGLAGSARVPISSTPAQGGASGRLVQEN